MAYLPYQGTREDFTTGGDPTTLYRNVWDNDANKQAGGYVNQPYAGDTPVVFDQQGYLDAQLAHMNNYIGNLESRESNEQQASQAQQGALARQAYQASMPQMPTMQPTQQPLYTGGGWGQASPTLQMGNMTQRQQAPAGILGTTNRGMYGGILGGE